MEFDFDVSSIFNSEVLKCDRISLGGDEHLCLKRNNHPSQLSDVINVMGDASAKAQGLHHSITTFNKMIDSDHVLFILKDPAIKELCRVIGILKVGKKKLFLENLHGGMHEITPLCILDFYVHESYQRKGCGLKLFQFMLRDQNVAVDQLAIDRPSDKLLGFMRKHYKELGDPVHQRNNFTVYKNIFSENTLVESGNFTIDDTSKRRQRHSDKISSSAPTASSNLTNNRHSFPSYGDFKLNCGSVASVVFGQRYSQNFEVKEQNEGINIFNQRADESVSKYSENCCPVVDSSMNIFGVPSPSNRYHLA